MLFSCSVLYRVTLSRYLFGRFLGEVRRINLLRANLAQSLWRGLRRGWVNRTWHMRSASRSSIMPVGKDMTSPGFSRRVGKDHYGVYSDSRTVRGGGVRVHLGPHQRPFDGPKCPIRGKDLRGTHRRGHYIPDASEGASYGKGS